MENLSKVNLNERNYSKTIFWKSKNTILNFETEIWNSLKSYS